MIQLAMSLFMASGGSRRLNGFIEREVLVTLDGCFYKKFNLTERIGKKSIIHVPMAFLGYAYMDGEDIFFDSLTLRTVMVNKNRPDFNP